MLDQHLSDIGVGQARVDRLFRVREKALRSSAEIGVIPIRPLDHIAQGVQNSW